MPIYNKIIGIKAIRRMFMNNSERILDFAKNNGGIIATKQVDKLNIKRGILYNLVRRGELERSSRGVYILPGSFDDELFNLQVKFGKGIFSNLTSLYLLGFTDRTPVRYDMTFPASYNTSAYKNLITAHRVKQEIYSRGIVNAKTPFGNTVKTYCIERTLCDILRTRNEIDVQIITDAFKKYAKSKFRNIPLLSEYAKLIRVENKVRSYLEVLL